MADDYTRYIAELLSTYPDLLIVSGEGERGSSEPYAGKRTVRAVQLRLARERCHGDRWARIQPDGRPDLGIS